MGSIDSATRMMGMTMRLYSRRVMTLNLIMVVNDPTSRTSPFSGLSIWMKSSMMVSVMASRGKDRWVHLQGNNLSILEIINCCILTTNMNWLEFIWNGRDFFACLFDFLVAFCLSAMSPRGCWPRSSGVGPSRAAKAVVNAIEHYEHFVPVEDKAAMLALEAEVRLVREFKENNEVEQVGGLILELGCTRTRN